jgi:hypothetical protein
MLRLEEHGPEIVFIKSAHNTRCRPISRLECMTPVSIKQLRATLQQKSIRSQKISQRQNWTTVSNIMVQTVVTSKHEDCNLVFTNHRKEDGIYPLKRDSKAQTMIKDLL